MAAVPDMDFSTGVTDDQVMEMNAWDLLVRDAVVWHMLVEENINDQTLQEGTRITGQFTPQQMQHQLGAKVPDVSGYGRSNPLVQWVGGAVETITFQARLFSGHRDDHTARNKFETLKLLRKAHEPLGRPPLVRFFWGSAIPGGMLCFVESLGGVQYDEIRPDGSLRGVTLSITLKKFTPFQVNRATTSPIARTPTHTVKSGETYEMIAYRRWGDPMLGIPLRQQNPRFPMEKWAPKGFADLVANEVIKLYPKRDLDNVKIKPQCHIFDPDNRAAMDNRRFFFQTRAFKTAVIPKR